MTVDTGGFTKKDQEYIIKQSKLVGASKHYFIDGKKELYEKIVSYIIKGKYFKRRSLSIISWSGKINYCY